MKHLIIEENYSHLYSQSQQEMYQDLTLSQLPGKYLGQRLKKFYEEAFSFWHFHWDKAFKEIGLNFEVTCEEFFRHEFILVLSYKKKIVGVALMDSFDLSNSIHRRHSYFKNYPEIIVEKLTKISHGALARTFGYLAVDPQYRKNYRLADILLGLAVNKVLSEPNPFLITYTRNTRKTHELTYRLGAIPVAEGLTIRGEGSDFVYFDRSSLKALLEHPQYSVIKSLWDRRIVDLSDEDNFNLYKGALNDESYL